MSDIASLLERFRRGPELLAVIMTGVFGEEEDFAPAPGKWSARQIIAHLADCELVFGQRIRHVIAEDNPTLVSFDQDAWARNLDYQRRKPKQSLESLRRMRAETYELLQGLAESAFDRVGSHTEKGPMTLRELVEYAANHAEAHARQLQQLREEFKKAKARPA